MLVKLVETWLAICFREGSDICHWHAHDKYRPAVFHCLSTLVPAVTAVLWTGLVTFGCCMCAQTYQHQSNLHYLANIYSLLCVGICWENRLDQPANASVSRYWLCQLYCCDFQRRRRSMQRYRRWWQLWFLTCHSVHVRLNYLWRLHPSNFHLLECTPETARALQRWVSPTNYTHTCITKSEGTL
jgi:hypothetical protein